MIADTTPEPVTLTEIVVVAARRADNRLLFAMLCVGVGGALLVNQTFGRAGWLGAAASLGVGAYGAWGLADRRLNALWAESDAFPTEVNALRLLRAVAAITATLCAVGVLGSIFVPALGLWRS